MGLLDFFKGLNPFDTLTNLFNTGYNVYQDQRNYNYQQDLQERLFERDDNAMQRRMQDYKNAGINPLMALGSSGAAVSSAGGFSGPQLSLDNSFFSNQQQKKLERDTIKQEMDKRNLDMQMMKINLRAGKIANWQAMQDLNTKRLEQEILKKQIEQMETSGIFPLSGFGKNYVDFNNLILPTLQKILDGISSTQSIKKMLEMPIIGTGSPEMIDEVKQKTHKAVQNFVDYLGKPLIKAPVKRISEYEARILRGNSDRKIIPGATHIPSKYKTIKKRFYTDKVKQQNKF